MVRRVLKPFKKLMDILRRYPVQTMVISIVVTLVSGITVAALQYKNVYLRENVRKLKVKNEENRKKIKVLKTEFSYLTAPERMQKISNEVLGDYKNIDEEDKIVTEEIPLNPNVGKKDQENAEENVR